MTAKYTATTLAEICDHFSMLASDQLACQRWLTTQKAKREAQLRAQVWNDAADILRNTTLLD